jgi:signal transduction histidine kinase
MSTLSKLWRAVGMQSGSLRRRITLFFIMFGLIPMVAAAVISSMAMIRSVERITEEQVAEHLRRIAEQTKTLAESAAKNLEILAAFPYVQLTFHRFPEPRRLSSVADDLELFRKSAGYFERLTLYAVDGRELVSTPPRGVGDHPSPTGLDTLAAAEGRGLLEQLDAYPRRVVFVRRVYNFQNTSRMVGVVAGEMNASVFFTPLDALQLGPGVEKRFETAGGAPLSPAPEVVRGRRPPMREYAASAPPLDWRIIVRIPESLLFRDAIELAIANAGLIILASLTAAIATAVMAWSISRTLNRLTDGARAYAAGVLEHRIPTSTDPDVERVGRAFNAMASELQARRQQLERADRLAALGLMAAGVAHEVKNPLASIRASAQVARDVLSDSPGSRFQFVKDMETVAGLMSGVMVEVDRLNKTLTGMLDFARPKPGAIQPCDMADIVDRALTFVRPEAARKRVQLSSEIERCPIQGDPDQLVQILLNLLLNALAAVQRQTGRIEVRAGRRKQGGAVVSVLDNGRGIPEDKLGMIFDPFFSMTEGGTGLGLSVTHALAAANGARLEVESREGQGTRMDLIFTHVATDEPKSDRDEPTAEETAWRK